MENKLLKSLEIANFDKINITKDKLEEIIKDSLERGYNGFDSVNKLEDKLDYADEYDYMFKPNVYNPHRRDLLNDLRFLNKNIKFANDNTKKHFIIYVGSSYHIYELSKYYPNIRFIVIYPDNQLIYNTDLINISSESNNFECPKHNYKNSKQDKIFELDDIELLNKLLPSDIRIYLIKEVCTLGLLLTIKDILPTDSILYLISNISIPAIDDNNNENQLQKELRFEYYNTQNNDYKFIKLLDTEYSWIKNFRFESSMINFRLPYDDKPNITTNLINKDNELLNSDLKFIPGEELKFISGKLYLEPWAGKSSTRSKMVIRKENIDNITIFKLDDYLGLMNYYNSIDRFISKHNNEKKLYEYGYCKCNDCFIEIKILKEYLSRNLEYIIEEFNIPKKYKLEKVIGLISKRISSLVYETQSFETHKNY